MSFFQNLFKSISAFFGSKKVQAIEGQAAAVVTAAAVPAVKAGLETAAAKSPVAEGVVQGIVEPLIDKEVSHIEQPPQQASS